MPSVHRSVVIGMRTSSETKARFAELALRQGLTESALLALLVDKVLAASAVDGARIAIETERTRDGECANDRLTLRLRPGDRALAAAKAAARRMKTASYLAMLVRTHVRGSPVMPPAEIDELKVTAGHLAAIARQLRSLGSPSVAAAAQTAATRDLLIGVGQTVENVREAVAAVVRTNLISWEAGNA